MELSKKEIEVKAHQILAGLRAAHPFLSEDELRRWAQEKLNQWLEEQGGLAPPSEQRMPTKGTKATKGTKGFWFPEYGLIYNSLAVRDASVDPGPFVENEPYRGLVRVVEAWESCLVVAPWGAGKTMMAQRLGEEPRSIFVPGLNDVLRVAGSILLGRHPEAEKIRPGQGDGRVRFISDVVAPEYIWDLVDASIKRGKRITDRRKLYSSRLYLEAGRGIYEVKESRLFCPGCKEHCKLDAYRNRTSGGWWEYDVATSVNLAIWSRLLNTEPCYAIGEAVKYEDYVGWKIYIDSPNEVAPRFLRALGLLCLTLERRGAQILFLGTPEQISMAKHYSDKFRKWRTVTLSQPEPGFWPSLLRERLRPVELSRVFTEEAVQTVAVKAYHNPREFLKLCSTLLIDAREEHRKDPIDEAYVKAHTATTLRLSHEEAVNVAVGRLRERGVSIVKNRDLREELRALGVEISPARLGRLMKAKGYVRRYNPDAEYFI